MPAYLIARIAITDMAGWNSYRAAVGPVVERFKGRYIVPGRSGVKVLEGADDGRNLIVIEFPSLDAIDKFWNSPDYAAAKKLRESAAQLDVWSVSGG